MAALRVRPRPVFQLTTNVPGQHTCVVRDRSPDREPQSRAPTGTGGATNDPQPVSRNQRHARPPLNPVQAESWNSRARINQATGMVMAQHRITAADGMARGQPWSAAAGTGSVRERWLRVDARSVRSSRIWTPTSSSWQDRPRWPGASGRRPVTASRPRCRWKSRRTRSTGLGWRLWWLNDPGPALELRARAFARLRHEGRDAEATAVAIWLARQYRGLYRRAEMADGWLSRARSLLSNLPDEGSLRGWLVLAESEVGLPHPRAVGAADQALRIAREHGDRDLEIVALTRRGACTGQRWRHRRGAVRSARGDDRRDLRRGP